MTYRDIVFGKEIEINTFQFNSAETIVKHVPTLTPIQRKSLPRCCRPG